MFVFTDQLILLHRFSDNCAQQYKCATAFTHIAQIQDANNIQVIYHYTEADHGKGPSDGLGAVIKKKLERMILGGRVINNAYEAYLALAQQKDNPNQHIMFVPQRKIKAELPVKVPDAKTVKGTQTYHMIRQSRANNVLICQDLSCSCSVCIEGHEGPCYYSQFRLTNL